MHTWSITAVQLGAETTTTFVMGLIINIQVPIPVGSRSADVDAADTTARFNCKVNSKIIIDDVQNQASYYIG